MAAHIVELFKLNSSESTAHSIVLMLFLIFFTMMYNLHSLDKLSKHFDKKTDTRLDWEDLLGELLTVCRWGVVVSRLLMRGKLIRELLQRERRNKGRGGPRSFIKQATKG